MSLQIRRLSYSIGAEIIGIDITQALDEKTFHGVQSAFLEYGVLLFRGQPLTPAQHVAFSRQFGALDKITAYPFRVTEPAYSEVFLVINKPTPDGKPPAMRQNGDLWHSDGSHWLIPAMASLLRGVEVPQVGGDTLFANMCVAYETLSDGMKKLLDGLCGVHIGEGRRIDDSTPERLAETLRLNPPVAQPLVRVHPETGRKALYLAEKLKHLVGLTAEEGKPLIQFLCNHATRPQFVYRHQWQKDDLVMWDNRCVMHNALGDFDRTQVRHMERTQVRGTPSGYVYGGPLQ